MQYLVTLLFFFLLLVGGALFKGLPDKLLEIMSHHRHVGSSLNSSPEVAHSKAEGARAELAPPTQARSTLPK